jgi:hypothetical protein
MESLPMPHHTEKSGIFLPASQLQRCLHETAEEQVSIKLPYSSPWENNPVQPLRRLKPLPQAKLENINSKL